MVSRLSTILTLTPTITIETAGLILGLGRGMCNLGLIGAADDVLQIMQYPLRRHMPQLKQQSTFSFAVSAPVEPEASAAIFEVAMELLVCNLASNFLLKR